VLNKRSKNAVVQACLVRSAFSLRSLWRVAGALFHDGICLHLRSTSKAVALALRADEELESLECSRET
jgi:hypothetical protein